MSRFRDIAADALRYWEPRRLVYNAVLLAVVAVHFVIGLPASKSLLATDNLLGAFILAVLANVAYCAAYAVDLFVQFSGLQTSWPRRRWIVLVVGTAFAAALTHFFAQGLTGSSLDPRDLHAFATRYTAAWCSQDPAQVASFFANDGSLTINGGKPAVGRAAITEAARGFMTAFPDMAVRMDRLERHGPTAEYRWTLTGTNTGPGGTGRSVKISGYEEWTIGPDGLIADSQGHFDAADYDRQLHGR